jgi:hypothetical protein
MLFYHMSPPIIFPRKGLGRICRLEVAASCNGAVIDFGRLVDRVDVPVEVRNCPETCLASLADILFGVVSHVVATID